MSVALQRTLTGRQRISFLRRQGKHPGTDAGLSPHALQAVERLCMGAKDAAIQTDSFPGLTL